MNTRLYAALSLAGALALASCTSTPEDAAAPSPSTVTVTVTATPAPTPPYTPAPEPAATTPAPVQTPSTTHVSAYELPAPGAYDLDTPEGLCKASEELTEGQVNKILVRDKFGGGAYGVTWDDLDVTTKDAVRNYKNAGYRIACPARAS